MKEEVAAEACEIAPSTCHECLTREVRIQYLSEGCPLCSARGLAEILYNECLAIEETIANLVKEHGVEWLVERMSDAHRARIKLRQEQMHEREVI